MAVFGRATKPVSQTVPAACDEPAVEDGESLDEAAAVRAQAEQLRAVAGQARAEHDTVFAAAQAEADRLLAEARQAASQLWQTAAGADRAAQKLEERHGQLVRAEQLRQEIPGAEAAALDLAAESDLLREQIHGLTHRLDQLGAEREETAALLSAASDAGNVDQVVESGTRLAAVDDVLAALGRQRDTQARRLEAIGAEDGPGELARALRHHQALHAELRRVENLLDPDRPEAAEDRLMEEFQLALAANIDRIAQERESTAKPQQHSVAHVTN